MDTIVKQKLSVINVGVASFGQNIRDCGADAIDLQWQPPASGNAEAGWALAQLINNEQIDAANKIAYERYLGAQPVLKGVSVAHKVIPGMDGQIILHSGPPVSWDNMCGPQQGAVLGAILFEGWAKKSR